MRYSDLSIRYNSQTGEPYIYADNTRYAGFFVRLAAYLLDRLIAAAVLTPVWLVLTLLPGSGQVLLFTWSLRAIVLYLLRAVYFVLFLKLRGATPGKLLFRIEVRSRRGRISWMDAVYRETVGRYLSGLVFGIGYLMAGFSSDRRGLHDRLCDTEVVYSL